MGKTVNPKTNTKFTGTTPQEFLDHCAMGGSVPEFCLHKMISRTTFDTWCDTYPQMKEAKKSGKILAEGWWLQKGRDHLVTHSSKESGTTRFDTNLYKFIMGGRFGHMGDKRLMDEVEAMRAQLDSMKTSMQPKTQIADEPEYEEEK